MTTIQDFRTELLLDEPAAQVYDAILDVRAWWFGKIEGDAAKLGDEFTYEVEAMHLSKQKLVELVPYEKIVWLVTESHLGFIKNTSEWTGTKIIFELHPEGGKTRLSFTHQGLTPDIECYGACSDGWDQIIHKSLANLVTHGVGVKIF